MSLGVQTDTIFRVYSMTKPMTSTALMMLYEEGRFQLQDPVKNYIPEFANLRVLRSPDGPLNETVAVVHAPTIQDLMRHTAGFTHGLASDAYDNQYTEANVFGLDDSLAEMMTRLSKIPLRVQPGTKFVYSVGLMSRRGWWRCCPECRSTSLWNSGCSCPWE